MNKRAYVGRDRREFTRLDFTTPLGCKVCKKQTVSKMLEGYTTNISPAGVLCNVQEKVKKNDIVWISFDRSTLSICEALEKRSFIYQNGIIGKVVRIKPKKDNTYDVGVQFITREEKNVSFIYPKSYFLKSGSQETDENEDIDNLEPEETEDDDRARTDKDSDEEADDEEAERKSWREDESEEDEER